MHRLLAVALISTSFACTRPIAESSESPRAAQASLAEPPQKGSLQAWPEATEYLLVNLDAQPATIELGPPRPAGLDAFWSVASTKGGGSAFFYSSRIHGSDETRVAHADVARVQDIRDASLFDYVAESVGPVAAGGIVLVHHLPSGRYLALVVDAIATADAKAAGKGPYAFADVTWYLSAEGSGGDFSSAL